MPPPRNSSLGRGLDDLIGGVPQTIGVAGVPQPRPAVPKEEIPEPALPDVNAVPSTKPVSPEPEGIDPIPEPVWWTVPRMALAGVLLLLVGSGMGYWAHPPVAVPVQTQGEEPQPRVVVVTNLIMAQTAPTVESPRVEASEFQALAGVHAVERDGILRLVFDAPLFSSRVVLDPGQAQLLEALGTILARHEGEWQVTIMGHADATPLRNAGGIKDNYELGLARATEVVRTLWRRAQVPMSMMQAVSSGDVNPPYPGEDEASRRKNRTATMWVRPVAVESSPPVPPGE